MKIKHSKYKNTGILFELLTRQLTSDTIAGNNPKALDFLKKHFNSKTELNAHSAPSAPDYRPHLRPHPAFGEHGFGLKLEQALRAKYGPRHHRQTGQASHRQEQAPFWLEMSKLILRHWQC